MELDVHLYLYGFRGPHGATFAQQINEALAIQGARMDRAAADEKTRKAAAVVVEATKKRPISSSTEFSDAKRQKLEQDAASTSAAFLADFDFTSLPAALITELVVANLQAFAEPALNVLVQAYRESHSIGAAPSESATVAASEEKPAVDVKKVPAALKEEPIDPLNMDIDEEEMEYEPDKLNMEVCRTPLSTLPMS